MSTQIAELTEFEHPPEEHPQHEPRRSSRNRWISLAAVVAVWVVVGTLLEGKGTQDLPTADVTPLQQWLTDLYGKVQDAKVQGDWYLKPFVWISDALNWLVTTLQHAFVSDPDRPLNVAQFGWAGVVAMSVLIAFFLAGLRIAVVSLAVLLIVGFAGYWDESVDTLIITGVSVAICVLIGIPLAIWMFRSKRAASAITPVLDAMQTMPAFAYLAPLALLFGIGAPGAVVVTLMYALPPLVRITAHGLRTVSTTTVEATTSMGSTDRQLLTKVQLPMARRTIIVGLNQTIMAALSMATIAAFIGGPGLGLPIVRALNALNVGVAFVAGMCVVLLAIMLDRTSETAAERAETVSSTRAQKLRTYGLMALSAAAVVALYLSHTELRWSVFPDSSLGFDIANYVNDWVDSATGAIDAITTGFADFVTAHILNNLEALLAGSPWWLVAGMILAVAALLGGAGVGPRARLIVAGALSALAVIAAGAWAGSTPDLPWLPYWAVVVALLLTSGFLGAGQALLPTAWCLVVIFAVGLWNDSMVTLSMTLVATLMVMILGVLVGTWMGRSHRADAFVRPILDFLQTMPALVYLIPALALFPPGKFLAIAAAVLYAAPVAIKIAADGVRGVAPTTIEAARSLGSSRWQMISKVQLPMSRGSIVLAANQGLLFVLSMVVIGALVGGGALGNLVTSGFAQGELFGKGLAAGIAITALGIMLDRITVHTAARYGRAETAS
jgi:glycine betaine/proline transport system permease protein